MYRIYGNRIPTKAFGGMGMNIYTIVVCPSGITSVIFKC